MTPLILLAVLVLVPSFAETSWADANVDVRRGPNNNDVSSIINCCKAVIDLPRGGRTPDNNNNNDYIIDKDEIIATLETRVKELETQLGTRQFGKSNIIEAEVETLPFSESKDTIEQQSRRQRGKRKRIIPNRLLSAAKNFIDRGSRILLRRNKTQQLDAEIGDDESKSSNIEGEEEVDHTFDELDQIIENTTQYTANNEDRGNDADDWIESIQNNNGSNKRQRKAILRTWMKQKLSRETSAAIQTIRSTIDKFPEYGVVDIFGLYSPKDVIWSIIALSKLQHVVADDNNKPINHNTKETIIDKQLLEELAHYCSFANAAYGWKGFVFCGRWHPFGGNNRMLLRTTGINKRDLVTANWHSKASRPAYYIARDTKRKAIVLGIRGSVSMRDILTDLCASCENFIVEDVIGDISATGDTGSCNTNNSNNATIPPLLVGCGHKGMVDAARSVARMTAKTISDELDANQDYTLVIVGHSMGGGVAAVICAMWNRRFHGRIRSIGYGNPCVFPVNSTEAFDNIISIQGSGDPFSTFSIGHLADLSKVISKLCQDRGLRDEILKRTKDMSSDDYKWCTEAMTFLQQQMDSVKLLPPGKTIYNLSGPIIDLPTDLNITGLEGGGRDATTSTAATILKPVDAITYNEMKLSPRMFDLSLHIPVRYEVLLKRLASSSNKDSNSKVE